MELARFDARAKSVDVAEALRRDGGVILEDCVEPALAEQAAAELRPRLDREGRQSENDFNGYATLRIGSVLKDCPTTAELIGHPRVLEVADAVLLPNCTNYRIGSTTAIEVCPGEHDQPLHRDDVIYPMDIPGVQLQIGTNWALDEFTRENGATRVVPDSHRWDRTRPPRDGDTVVQAVMSKGSVLVYLGTTWHGGGANRTDRARLGLVNTYSLGWLRQETNQYLSVPREVADRYPEPIRHLLGYQQSGLLGYFPD